MSKGLERFLAIFGLTTIALILQIELGYFLNFRPNLILTLLITASFFYKLIEILTLALIIILIINWQPAISPEIFVILIFPLLSFYLRRFLPWQNWFNNLILILGGLIIFYFAANFSFFFLNNLKFQSELAISLILGSVIFFVFKKLS